jgi:hypothetical protein
LFLDHSPIQSQAQAKDFKERLVDILRNRGYPNGDSVFNDGVVRRANRPIAAGRPPCR